MKNLFLFFLGWCLANPLVSVNAFAPRSSISFPIISTRQQKQGLQLGMVPSSPVKWAIVHCVGGVLGVPTVAKAVDTWYRKIDLPSWTPPDRLFAPIWTLLYACMGVAASRVYEKTSNLLCPPLIAWYIHFALNLSWVPVFFGMKRLRMGMVINSLMLVTLGITIPLFYRSNPLSGLLLLPYLAWNSFATILNSSICRRNPTENGYNEAMLQSDIADLQKKAAEYAGV